MELAGGNAKPSFNTGNIVRPEGTGSGVLGTVHILVCRGGIQWTSFVGDAEDAHSSKPSPSSKFLVLSGGSHIDALATHVK